MARRLTERRRSSSRIAALRAIGPSTRSRPIRSRSSSAPTTSSPIWSRPRRTAHRAPRAAARRHDRCEVAAGVRVAQVDQDSRRQVRRRLLRQRLHARGDQAAARGAAESGALQGVRRPVTVPTFEEILDLVAAESAKRDRRIGVYPETKHPAFHLALGLPLEDRLLTTLRRRGLIAKGRRSSFSRSRAPTCSTCVEDESAARAADGRRFAHL